MKRSIMKTLSDNKKLNKVLNKVISICLLILLWQLMSMYMFAVPSPLSTLRAFLNEWSGSTSTHLGKNEILFAFQNTIVRVLISFIFTIIIGIIIGCALGLSKVFKSLFNSWIVLGASMPPLVIIVITYITNGLNEKSVYIAAILTTVFTIAQNVEEGIRAIDTKLIEMANALHASTGMKLRHVILPQINPYVIASSRFGISLIFKMIIFIELLGCSNGIGYMIQKWYTLNKMVYVLAYAIVFIVVALLFDMLIGNVIEPRLFKWRKNNLSH